MESKNTAAETLEEGYVESQLSQAENPSDRSLEERESVFLCNLSENCAPDVYSGLCEISHVELSRKLGHISLEESVVFDDIAGYNQISKGSLESESLVCDSIAANNQTNKGSLDSFADQNLSVLLNVDAINIDDVLVSQGELKYSGNDGIHIGKVEEHVEKSDDGVLQMQPHEPGSPTKIEVSGNGMNLFVDVFGPLDGIPERQVLEKTESNQEYSLDENQTVSLGVENTSAKNEHTFDVGDLVWVKTRTQLWWPGIISDPCKSNNAAKSEKKGSFFVKYFGNVYSAWCDNSDLKPFPEYFEQMSAQNNSRSFSGSVEKALCEFGHHIKTKMTCPCFSNDNQNIEQSRSNREDKKNKFDALSLSRFDPATFSAHIRDLACSVDAPDKIELTVTKNRLSSFYCSMGHYQLPLHLLRSGGDTSEIVDEGLKSASRSFQNPGKTHDDDLTVGRRRKRNQHSDDNIATSGKSSESRERKKSKYLSYPYIDVKQEKNAVSTVGPKTEDLKNSSSPFTKPDDQKRGSTKSHKGNHVISKEDDIDACSAELLNELHSTARDYFYLGGSKYSDSLKRFYSSFRMYTFLNADIASKDGGEGSEGQMKTDDPEAKGTAIKKRAKKKKENSTEADEVQMKTDDPEAKGTAVKKSAKKKKENSTEADEVQMKTDDPEAKGTVVKKRAKKKKENSTEADEVQMKIDVPEAKGTVAKKRAKKKKENSTEADEVQMKTDDPEAKGSVVKKRAKKKKEKSISAVLESTKKSSDSDTNIYSNGSCMISFQQAIPEKMEKSTTPPLPDINSIPKLPDLNGIQTSPFGEASTNLGKALPEQRIEGLASPNVTATLQNIPQSNECSNEQSNLGGLLKEFVRQPLQMEIFPSADKPECKKRKRKETTDSDIPDLNGNMLDFSSSEKTLLPEGNHTLQEKIDKKRVVNKVEDPGGSLLLDFAKGIDLPSKETLVATFSRFGLLKESEIQVVEDSSVEIVYERSSDARFAFRSLEKSNVFGESLIGFKLHRVPLLSPAHSRKKEKKSRPKTTMKPHVPANASKSNNPPPDMSFIRQNVEKMKSMLEKAGDSLSPEMRAKLEDEIKVFLDKIGGSVGGSSSS